MEELIEKIRDQGCYVGDEIIKVDSFLNHNIDVGLNLRIAAFMKSELIASGISQVTKILTAEVSGIPLGFSIARLFNVDLVYAKKRYSRIMNSDYYFAGIKSRTKSTKTNLLVDRLFLSAQDRVIIVDDFLATGSTSRGLANIVSQSKATLLAFGSIIEKPSEDGRFSLAEFDVPIISLAKVNFFKEKFYVS